MPTPMSPPVRECVELWALEMALLGMRFFWSLFGFRPSLASLDGDAPVLARIWVKVRVAGVISAGGPESTGPSMNSVLSRVGVK